MKSLPKILKIFFLSVFVVQLIGLAALLFIPEIGQAADAIKFKPQVSIPGSNFTAGESGSIKSTSLAEYIQAIYKYAIGIVGILATVVMMFGGFKYLMAGGDSGKISDAKEWITAALTGLVIALSSYLILNTVNPALTQLKPIDAGAMGCCPGKGYTTKNSCTSGWDEKKVYDSDTKKCSSCLSVTSESSCTGNCIWNDGACKDEETVDTTSHYTTTSGCCIMTSSSPVTQCYDVENTSSCNASFQNGATGTFTTGKKCYWSTDWAGNSVATCVNK